MVQEYGRYFGMPTCCLRGGCLTGPNHSRRRAARFPQLPGQVQPRGPRVQGLRLQGQSRCATTSIRSTSRASSTPFGEAPRSARFTTSAAGAANSTSILEAFERVAALSGGKMKSEYVEQESRRRPHLLHQRSAQDAGALSVLGHYQVARRYFSGDFPHRVSQQPGRLRGLKAQMYELIIEPGREERNYWRDLWRYRELFAILAWRDVRCATSRRSSASPGRWCGRS